MNDDKMTCTMLGAWLTELFLNERSDQLNNLHHHHHHHHTSTTTTTGSVPTRNEIESSQRAMLAQFLNYNVNNMDVKTILNILTSHDISAMECATYAAKSGDIATAVNAALSMGGGGSNRVRKQ